MEQHLILAVGGIGLFIYSLRIITNAFDQLDSDAVRKWIERITSRSYLSVSLGLIITLIFQASATTILISMGLLNRSLLTLEQATLIMLGAAVGTTVKIWFHWEAPLVLGAMLIFGATLGLLIHWRRTRLRTLELALGVGLTILGLHLMTSGLAPILESPTVQALLSSCKGATFGDVSLSVLVGCLATLLVQSSSSIVIVVLGLAAKGVVTFEAASAVILGANIGTTSTAFVLSFGQSVHAKRLATMHFISKFVGVAFSVLFFKSFLSLILLVLSPWPGIAEIHKLAMVHTGFNLINLIFWWTLLPVLMKAGKAIWADHFAHESWFSSLGVQKLLERLPERAIEEGQQEIQEIVRGFSELTQTCLSLLTDQSHTQLSRETLGASLSKDLERFDKRLRSLESVMGRVSVRWGESFQFQFQIYGILEKIYKLNRITLALSELVRVVSTDESTQGTIGAGLQGQGSLKSSILGLGDLIGKLWNDFYQALPEEGESQVSQDLNSDGAILFDLFMKDQDFRTGIRLQRIYSALFSLFKELDTVSESMIRSPKGELPGGGKRTFTFIIKTGRDHSPHLIVNPDGGDRI